MSRFSLIRLICLIIPIVFAVSLCHCVPAKRVHAESLAVSLRVGSTQVIFSGYTSPSAYVAIKQGETVIGSTTADDDGLFSKTIEVDDVGIMTFYLYTIDVGNRQSATIAYTLNIDPGVAISIENILTPPTIYQLNNPTTQGETIIIGGSTNPSSSITILVSTGTTYTIPVGEDGYWQFDFSLGDHRDFVVSATARLPGNHLSLSSQSLSFALLPRISSPSTPDSPTPSPLLALPRLPSWLLFFDSNQDSALTFDELKGIVRRWIVEWRSSLSSQNDTCDLNSDSACNLVDFSILLYYIGR